MNNGNREMSFLSQSFRRAGATVLGIFLAAGGSEVYAAPGGLAARAASLSDTAGRTATPHDMGKIRRIVADLKQAGVLINAIGRRTFRAVTHLDISGEAIEEAGRLFAAILTR